MEYLVPPAADLGRHYKDVAAAAAGEQEKEKSITLKRVSAEYLFDPAGDLPSAEQLSAVRLPERGAHPCTTAAAMRRRNSTGFFIFE